MKQSTLKVAGGKLLRVNVETENADDGPVIQKIRLTGDFFLHPEDALPAVENALEGLEWPAEEDVYIEAIQKALDEKNAVFIGLSPADIAQAIVRAREPEEVLNPNAKLRTKVE